MRLVIGSDHRGLALKQRVIDLVKVAGHSIEDYGAYTIDSVNYPDIAKKVCDAVVNGLFDRGILICGTGIGMCMAANKIRGVRAAQVFSVLTACRARQHNDANIICLGAENDQSELPEIIKSILTCEFQGGHHQARLEMLHKMEQQSS